MNRLRTYKLGTYKSPHLLNLAKTHLRERPNTPLSIRGRSLSGRRVLLYLVEDLAREMGWYPRCIFGFNDWNELGSRIVASLEDPTFRETKPLDRRIKVFSTETSFEEIANRIRMAMRTANVSSRVLVLIEHLDAHLDSESINRDYTKDKNAQQLLNFLCRDSGLPINFVYTITGDRYRSNTRGLPEYERYDCEIRVATWTHEEYPIALQALAEGNLVFEDYVADILYAETAGLAWLTRLLVSYILLHATQKPHIVRCEDISNAVAYLLSEKCQDLTRWVTVDFDRAEMYLLYLCVEGFYHFNIYNPKFWYMEAASDSLYREGFIVEGEDHHYRHKSLLLARWFKKYVSY